MRSSRSSALLLVERLQVLGLALADDLHPPRLDVGVVAGEGEPRLLHPRMGDQVVQVRLAGEDAEAEVGQLLAQQLRAPAPRRCRAPSDTSGCVSLSISRPHRCRRSYTRAASCRPRSRLGMPVRLDPARDGGQHLQVLGRRAAGRDDQEEDLHRLAVGRPELHPFRHQADRHHALREAVAACSAGWRPRWPMPVEPSCSRSQSFWNSSSPFADQPLPRDALGEGAQHPRAIRRRQIREDQLRPGQRAETHTLRRSACGRSTRGCSARRGTSPRCGGRSGSPRG